jgi:hypothetical protein
MLYKRAFLQVFGVLGLLWALGTCPVSGAGWKTLRGHVPPVTSRLTAIGSLPATNELRLALGLPLRDAAGLDKFLAGICDPASPSFRHYLTPEEFTARFGPTEADYAAVKEFARTNGLKLTATHGNRLLLDVSGRAADVERAFHLHLRTFRHPTEARDFFAPDAEPTVEANLPVADVSGLDNFSRPHPKVHRSDAATILAKAATPQSGSSPSGTYIGPDFRNAYVPGTTLDGTGQMVGLLQFDGYYASDITNYENLLPGSPQVPLQTVLLDGYDGTPTANGNIEVSLDIEMAISMAPGLSQIVVFEAGPTGIPNDILNTMAASNMVKNLSCSWGWSGGPRSTTENIFLQMAAQGQSFFNASGDSDAFTPGQVDSSSFDGSPSSSPNITQVGGTTLTMNGTGGSYASETVWNRGQAVGSSGGISSSYAIPSWQLGINSFLANGGSTTHRNIPDVALTAENVYVIYANGSSVNVGGTSCAAPLWAGFMALVNQQAVATGRPVVGFINPIIYELANESIYNAAFHDTTTGNNTSSASPNAFYAGPGYDLCTGIGTPNGTNLINALINPDPLIVISNYGFNAIGSAAGTFNIATQTFYLTNAGDSTLEWSLINTSAWLDVSTSGGTLAVGASDSMVVSLNTVASNLTAGTYPAGIWFSNVTSGVAHARQFSLKVSDALVILPPNNFSFIGPSGGPFIPASQGIILTNARSDTLNWSINNTSAWFNVSPASDSLSSGAQANVTFTLTPAATNLPDGSYSATFQVTNLASQFVQVITGSVLVGQPLVQNGGFETGDFASWTLNGDAGAFNYVDNGSTVTAIPPHSGTYFAALGEAGFLATLSQTLATVASQKYLISLWLNSPNVSPSNPNEFKVSWNGSVIYDKVNISRIGWTNLHFVVTATSINTVLQFGARDDNYYLGLDDVTVTPGFAPAISTQPTPTNLTILSGSNAIFSVAASGSAPLNYHWRKNGTNLSNGGNISGATTNLLMFTAATTNNSGNYSLVVTNIFGAITSSVAALTVVLPPTITGPLTNQTIECGSNVTFAVSAGGTPPLNYQWSLDGTPISDATNTSLALTNIHLPNHTVTLVVTNLYASLTSNAKLTVHDTTAPVITLNGSNPIFIELGGAFSDPGATANDVCAGSLSVVTGEIVNADMVGTNTLVYTAADGNGNTNTVTRTVIVRDTTPPAILWSFTNLVQEADTNCSAAMPDVTGTNFILATDLSGALTISQSPTNGAVLLIGTNMMVITIKDASSNAAYSTNFIIVQDQTPPLILSQPQNRTNLVGTTANFSAAATACTPVAFQWFFNSAALTDQTNSALTLVSVSLTNAGDYSVVVIAAGGSTTSAVATLTVDLISTSLALDSSANPSGYKDNLNFTATISPANASGTVQFFTNGVTFDSEMVVAGQAASTNIASLPRGTNLITAIYSGNANHLAATNTLAQLVANHPPIAAAAFYRRAAGSSLNLAVAGLATNWTDVDGDAISLAGFSVSTNGVTLTNNAGTLVYFNSNNVADQFVCAISDDWGGTNFQTVNIAVVFPGITGVAANPNGSFTLNLAGAPGHTYVLEATTNLISSANWLPVATNTLGTNGVWQFTDASATNFPQQFYRLKFAP